MPLGAAFALMPPDRRLTHLPDSREMCMAGLWWSIRDCECHWFSLGSEGGYGRLGAPDDSVVPRTTGVEEGKSKPSNTLCPEPKSTAGATSRL